MKQPLRIQLLAGLCLAGCSAGSVGTGDAQTDGMIHPNDGHVIRTDSIELDAGDRADLLTTSTDAATGKVPRRCHIEYGSAYNPPAVYPIKKSVQAIYIDTFNTYFQIATSWIQFWNIAKTSATLDWQYTDKWYDEIIKSDATKKPKFHAIIWHKEDRVGVKDDGFLDWYEQLPTNAARTQALKTYVQSTVKHLRKKGIRLFDLVNHAAAHGSDTNYMLTGMNRVDAIAAIFTWARAADSSGVYGLNEGNISEGVRKLLCRDLGCDLYLG